MGQHDFLLSSKTKYIGSISVKNHLIGGLTLFTLNKLKFLFVMMYEPKINNNIQKNYN